MSLITIDPLSKYPSKPNDELVEECGILPLFFMKAVMVQEEPTLDRVWELVDDQYGFGLYKMTGSTVTKDGVWQYPEDPDLYPLMKLQEGNVEMLVYPYALVAMRDTSGRTLCTRMD
jgi:hypothetical protein